MRVFSLLGLSLLTATVSALHNHHGHARFHHGTATSVAAQPTSPLEHRLLKRAPKNDDYTCGPDRPCKNKACCGSNNVCGFGDLYCGEGCQSHCDAKAECGRDATTPGQLCPLNICCSEFGFCGSTEEFCSSGCQSNCKDPNRPSRGKSSDVRNKVIGYYESWRAGGKKCGMMAPEEIPVEYLDQVNMAFVYIDPKDYSIIAMDDETMAPKIFERTADIKTRNPKAKIWVSVGGWTFNDPGTFQSVFSDIAASSDKTNQFATNLMEFLDKYGFDGIDLDWEYPGADDRGGKEADVKNYVSMMKILKKRLQGGNDYSKKWGISITVPTSYWYLRWFDIVGLESVIDEFNLMAYDLHGTWDSDDPIGPYVYAHTNLTEIDMALDLFWRNDIDPSKINLGLAFYGRTYELQTPLCATPGCEWKNPGPKGECTTTAGILSYSEIQEIISDSNISPKYDEDAGVYYITYGKGGKNWASFDDAISFQAKIDLANSYGLGGILVWAVDQDDRHFNALRGVTGQDVEPPTMPENGFGAFTLDQCYITDCGDKCSKGDITMTKLNEDESGRGCSGKDHNQRSFCCPAGNAPDSDTCYWTGGPVNCHGQCAAGEVTMVLDDYGDSKKRCTNGGKKAWCCPATNGQEAIQQCKLATTGEKCPKDRPQELTSVYWAADLGFGGAPLNYEQKFCCPEEPSYDLDKCGWYGENYYCNDSECPIGQVELFRWHGWHAGPPKSSSGCNKGRQQAFCCPPPLSDGSAFLPVPLENLFPDAGDFSDSVTTTFAEAFDGSPDEISTVDASNVGTDPNKRAFAWTIMVGEEEDVQSFDKRDGSHLTLFDCPNPHEDDHSVQKLKAVCVGGTEENNNCEDILKGGVQGTVVRLPSHCGPDDWVVAVHFDVSLNQTVPGHIQRRSSSSTKVYDFHYNYNFQQLRRDGGEVYFRTDFSTHPGYWDEIVKADRDSSIGKRSAENWRHLDRRWLAESDKTSWLNRFNDLLTQGKTGLKKKYEFNQCLFQADAVCANAETDTSAFVYGELETTMDMGTTLIGKLRNFQFSEAFSFFNQEGFSMRAGAGIRAKARLYMDSGWHSIGNFDAFGMDLNLKGIFSIKPYFAVDARIEADAYLSTQATVEMTISHDRFRYYLPNSMGHSPNEITGGFNMETVTGPISGFGKIDARAGGGVVFGFKPRIAMDINLAFHGSQYVDTSIELSTPGSIRLDAALATSCSAGMQFDVTGHMDLDFQVKNALPGWESKSYTWRDTEPKTIYSGCVPFSVLAGKRDVEGGNETSLISRSTTGDDLTIPKQSSSTCAFSTKGVYCADPDDNGDPSPNCDLRDLSYLDDDDDDSEGALTRRGDSDIFKRNSKSLEYCAGIYESEGKNFKGFGPGGKNTIAFSNYPSGSELVAEKYYPNADTYDNEDWGNCNNYNLVKLASTPTKPTDKKANNGRSYDSEHVLEAQTVQRFFNHVGMKWSNLTSPTAAKNDNAREYEIPTKGSKGKIPWCKWMRAWWNGANGFNANRALGSVYPGYNHHYTEEFVLYESALNSKVKQGWFSGNKLTGEKKIDEQIEHRQWDNVAKTLKLHILAWKYYYIDSIKETLVKQANRIENQLRYLDEQGGITANVGTWGGKYDKGYIPQGLADEWKVWVRSEHERVQFNVKQFLLKYAQEAYNQNRPSSATLNPGESSQSNKDIIELFENALDEVKGLQSWDIDWDGDAMDTS